jgi:hydroxypyruvate reductase
MKTSSDPRRLLLDLYAAALARVEGRAAVRNFLAGRAASPCHVIAIGKAASAMALGAQDALGDRIGAMLVITKPGHVDAGLARSAVVFESGHPTPDLASLAAGDALLDFLAAAPADEPLLFLISGGTSALVEVLPEGVSLDDLAALNHWMLGAGLEIATINRLRGRMSLIKQGRLARHLAGKPALVLLISDVPGDDATVIGSGLLAAPASTAVPQVPEWLQSALSHGVEAPAQGDPVFANIETHVLATNGDARHAVVERAAALGLPVQRDEALHRDVRAAAQWIASTAVGGSPGLYVWGGENTVHLPAVPGRGGRCQQLALEFATRIAGRADITLLAAGTDGSDGPGEDAGAIVDGGTVARGEAEAFDARDALLRADAGSFLEASGDLVSTGPTGTNVMDLVLVLKS